MFIESLFKNKLSELPKNILINFSLPNLKRAWKEIYISKPSKKRKYSKGVDGISLEDFKKKEIEYLSEIHRQLQGGFFVFDKLKYYKIGSAAKSRDIQAPTVKDRIVQKILNEYLASTYLRDKFQSIGIVGSVEGTTVESVIKTILGFHEDGYVYVLKTDIQKYFPSINVPRLKKVISSNIPDIEARKYLNGYLKQTELPGIPQGPPLSPIMANLYLMALDKYLAKRKNVKHVRYVDDVLLFCKTEADAVKAFKFLDGYFRRVHLSVHPLVTPGKTVIDRFDNGNVDALGVTYKDGKLGIKLKKVVQFREEVISPIPRVRYLESFKGDSITESLDILVKTLNYQIEGWGGAYKFCDVEKLFNNMDRKIEENFKLLLSRVKLSEHKKASLVKSIKKFAAIKQRKRKVKKKRVVSPFV